MFYRVKRTRLAFGIVLLGTVLLAPGRSAAAGRIALGPRAQAVSRGGAATAVASRSILDRLQEFLRGHGARAQSGPSPVHGSAGCGIDPNGAPRCPGW